MVKAHMDSILIKLGAQDSLPTKQKPCGLNMEGEFHLFWKVFKRFWKEIMSFDNHFSSF